MLSTLDVDKSPDLDIALNTLGVENQRARKHDEAEALFREALAIKTRLLGPEHPEIAGLLENIAHVLRDKSNFAEALYRQVLGVRRKLLGEEHEDVATSLHNLARVLYDQKRFLRGRIDVSGRPVAAAQTARRQAPGSRNLGAQYRSGPRSGKTVA